MKNYKTENLVIITQARIGSTRLPGKILKKVCGIPLLEFHIERLKQAKLVSNVIIATTTKTQDDEIEEFSTIRKIPFFRGSEDDVLSRYFETALKFHADHIIRVTSDCPLIDPAIIDRVVEQYFKSGKNYASNTLELTYPRGMDVEIFSFNTLKEMHDSATLDHEREHVTPWIRENPSFLKHNIFNPDGNQYKHRLTVDTPDDFKVIKHIIENLYPKKNMNFTLSDIIDYLDNNPYIAKMNSNVTQKPL